MYNLLSKIISLIILATTIVMPMVATAEELSDTEIAELRKQMVQQRKQLELSREQLKAAAISMQETSRKLAKTKRKLNIENREDEHFIVTSSVHEYTAGRSASIGLVISQSDDAGDIKIIGLSPNGPALNAGLQKGDVILAIQGDDLLTIEESRRLSVLLENLQQATPEEPITLTVLRDDKPITVSLTPQRRLPGSLHTVILPPPPPQPPLPPLHKLTQTQTQSTTDDSGMVTVITDSNDSANESSKQKVSMRVVSRDGDFDDFSPEAMEIHIKNLENQLINFDFDMDDFPGNIEMESFEVLINTAKDTAFTWFDRGMLEGLEMARLNPELGVFFKAESGVLVLQADTDNTLNLKTGDVIIAVDGELVNRPTEVMRKLRFLKDGDTTNLEVIRDGQAETIRSQAVDKFSQSFLFKKFRNTPIADEIKY